MAIDVIDTSHDALFELVFRGHSDMAQDRAGELGEEALNKVEPRAVLGGEGELEASGRSSGEPSSGFFRYMRGMIIEDQLDCSPGRVSSIEELEQFDELAAAMAISHERMDLAGKLSKPVLDLSDNVG